MFLNMNKGRLFLSNKKKSSEALLNCILELFEVKRSDFLKKIAIIEVVVINGLFPKPL